MSYSGTFTLDDDGLRLNVAVTEESGRKTTLVVAFTFRELTRSLDLRSFFHAIIARRVMDAILTLDDED